MDAATGKNWHPEVLPGLDAATTTRESEKARSKGNAHGHVHGLGANPILPQINRRVNFCAILA